MKYVLEVHFTCHQTVTTIKEADDENHTLMSEQQNSPKQELYSFNNVIQVHY